MIHHPDKGGNTATFVKIKDAYEALLNGDSGEKPIHQDYSKQKYRYYEDAKARKSGGEFRFEGIRKDQDGYLVRFFLKNVNTIKIYGLNGDKIGHYTVDYVNGFTNLVVGWEEAKKAEYYFRVVLEDQSGGSAEKIYKVKPPFVPNWYQKILSKLKIKKYG